MEATLNRRSFLYSLVVPTAVSLLPKLSTPTLKGIDPREALNVGLVDPAMVLWTEYAGLVYIGEHSIHFYDAL